MLSSVAVLACTSLAMPAAKAQAAPGYLYVWGSAADTASPNRDSTVKPPRARPAVFLTIDVRRDSPTLGKVVGAMLVDAAGLAAHHTEHALATDGILFANDFGVGRTYRFDLNTPGAPNLLGHFSKAGPLAYPHSFVRLANGNVLATFQRRTSGDSTAPPGGIAELRRNGTLVRWSSAAPKGIDSTTILPYSLEVVPAIDRVITTSTSMTSDVGVHVQIWRLSTLELLQTMEVPRASGDAMSHGHAATTSKASAPPPHDTHHMLPGEPRLLADGRTVMFGTFTCGLYRLTGIEATPKLEFLRAFPGEDCAVPLRVGRFWVQTVPADRALVVLDVSDSARPREVSRLTFDERVTPHWLSVDATGRHVVMTSGTPRDARVHVARFDPATGALTLDKDTPTIDLSRVAIRGLGVVRVVPHGSVFGPAASTR
ncbi:MAG: hypothetical protein ABI664_07890 [bacterium]